MMKRLLPFLAVFTLLASPAQALKMIIWDRDMQTTLGAGESSGGNRFNVQLIRNFSGPVIVIFSQTDDEKRNATFKNLQNRYDGVLKNGELTLMPDPTDNKLEKNDKPDSKPTPGASPSSNASNTAQYSTAQSVGLTLTKLLQQFKLTVSVQTTSQTNPDQQDAPGSPGTSSTAGNGNSNLKTLDLKGK